MATHNPFAHYGNIVHGAQFFGRREELEIVKTRVLGEGQGGGNLAVIGEPRIGKSSLVYQALMEPRCDLLLHKILPLWIPLATIDQPRSFFLTLVTNCHDDILDQEWHTPPLLRAKEEFDRFRCSEWVDFRNGLERYFTKVRQAGVSVLFILDEFDAARLLFQGQVYAIQQVRELSYKPECRVTWVTTSRRTIADIAVQSAEISTLDGVFENLFLQPFRANELDPFVKRLEGVGISPTVADQEILAEYTGFHPYLLDLIGFQLVQANIRAQHPEFRQVCQEASPKIREHYARVASFLEEEGNLSKLIQILFGPVYDVMNDDVDRLRQYGLLRQEGDQYRAYSKHFEDYLRIRSRQVDLWPLWRESEQGMRRLVLHFLRDRFGDDWVPGVLRARPKLEKMIDACKESQSREQKNFGPLASGNLLEFTYPMDLFVIMGTEWGWFQDILKDDKAVWAKRFEMLAKIRTPLAHNRAAAIPEADRDQVTGICKHTLELLRGWEDGLC